MDYNTGIYGEDWSSYQSTTPEITGLSFAFVKVTEGTAYVNPKWVAQRDHAKSNGLVWGAYHYPNMHNPVQAEADYFLGQVEWQPEDIAILDWEGYEEGNFGISYIDQAKYKDAWLRYVKSKLPNNPVGLYCNIDYWRYIDSTGYFGDFLWISDPSRIAGHPGIQGPWMFHQYATGTVDADYCQLGSTEELRAWVSSFRGAEAPSQETVLSEADMLSYLPMILAGSTVDVPVEPAGTMQAPKGGAYNGPIWLALGPVAHPGTASVALWSGGVKGPVQTKTLTPGRKVVIPLPVDGSVEAVHIETDVDLLGYVVGRQVA